MPIQQRVNQFQKKLKQDKNHRYYSWEHCYEYFNRKKGEIDLDTACLHLAFYLASWGMYRGSSDLLWKDYLVHKEIVQEILKHKATLQGTDFSKESERKIKLVADLAEKISELYAENLKKVNGEKRAAIPISKILISKVLLGTLGCIPAYDRFLVKGLRKHGIKPATLSVKGIVSLVEFYNAHREKVDPLSKETKINRNNEIHYPPMKIIDMYFWQDGAGK